MPSLSIALQVQQAIALLILGEKVGLRGEDIAIQHIECLGCVDLNDAQIQPIPIVRNDVGAFADECILSGYRIRYLMEHDDMTRSLGFKLELTGEALGIIYDSLDNNHYLDHHYRCIVRVHGISAHGDGPVSVEEYLKIIRYLVGIDCNAESFGKFRDYSCSSGAFGQYHVTLNVHTAMQKESSDCIEALVNLGELFPAFLLSKLEQSHKQEQASLELACDEVAAYYSNLELIELCVAPLLLHGIDRRISAKITAFRYGFKEHYAISIDHTFAYNPLVPIDSDGPGDGDTADERIDSVPYDSMIPLVRVHSSCFTGDLLQSLRCDCHPQLHAAINEIALHPMGGFLIYLQQEGRGIGLVNKLRTYHLQQYLGLDTSEANRYLGLSDDAREFGLAAKILQHLDVHRIMLLSNNPSKMAELEKNGINVVRCVPHVMLNTEELERYFAAKAEKFGHKNLANAKGV